MSRIVNLTDGETADELLTSRLIDGFLGGGKLLDDEPLESYLEGDEQPKYVLRNKSAGLEIDGSGGTRTLESGSDYQTLALVTDVRLVFVSGRPDGDEVAELSLSDVLEAKADSTGFRESTLTIETLSGETWTFACTEDLTEVATQVDAMAQGWATAERLLDEVENAITTAGTELDDGHYDRAAEALEGTGTKLETTLERIDEVGRGARAIIERRARRTTDWLTDIQRELLASEAGRAHARAQGAWDEGAYESAAAAYETAINAYDRAIETAGSVPSDWTLQQRLRGAVSERELLRVGPAIDADAARRRGKKTVDPEKAASEWEDALDGYREMLGLDWGRTDRTFVVNRDRIREQTAAIADDAILDYHKAGRQWLRSGDKLATQGREKQAREVYERARTQFEEAHQLAREVQPEHVDDIEDALETVEDRLAGEMPEEVPDEKPLAAAVIGGLGQTPSESSSDDTAADTTREGEWYGTADATGSDGWSDRETDDQPATDSDDRETDDQPATDSDDGETDDQPATDSGVEETDDQPATDSGVEETDATTDWGGEATTDTEKKAGSEADRAGDGSEQRKPESAEADDDETLLSQIQSEKTADDGDTGGSGTGEAQSGGRDRTPVDQYTDAAISEWLRALSDEQFRTLVTELWEAQGWSATVFSVGADSVYDIVAMRTEPVDERLLVWTVHRPGDGTVDAAAIKQCAKARESSKGADSAVLVTTGSLTSSATARAEDLDVEVVGADELVELLRFEELVDRLATTVETA